jgi:pimeloyl-ACP methyl ester carboxylesterase
MKTVIYISIVLLVTVIQGCKQEADNMDSKNEPMDSSQSITPSFQNGYSDVNGIKMYYEIYGDGKPLVLIHGGGSTVQTSFGKIIPLLAKTRKVIGVELQAHGRTSDRNAPISFEQDADDVAVLLKNLDIDKADVLGFSNGGNTTMQLAIRHPEVVDRIIVASAFYKRDGMGPGFWDFMKKGTINDMPSVLKEEFLKVNPDSAKLQNLFEKCSQRMLTFKDWNDGDLRSIKAKTLIVAGDNDVATPEHYVIMHRQIPESKLMIIPGGHGEFMGEISFPNTERNAASFALLIEEFLRKP